MNAICGFIGRTRGAAPITPTLPRMAEALPVRAGDVLHTYALDAGGFASHAGDAAAGRDSAHQEPGLTVVCAAELYNAAVLREEVGDALPPAAGEAALIAALYRRHQLGCVRQLQGAFAFALWDVERARLLLATDGFGIQPLHYLVGEPGLMFGSRIAAILRAAATPPGIDPQAILHYVYFSVVPTPHTVYRGIRKLPPGHLLTYADGAMHLEPYWDVSYADAPVRLADCAPPIPRLLGDAVRAQATYGGAADRVGAFLSGGTDSSAISGLLGDALQRPARTFSIGFAEADFNEIGYARLAAERFRSEHHEYFVTAEDAAAFLPQLAAAYDEPFGNSSAIGAYYCARLARAAGVDTLLAGDGGDELFAGNTRYVANQIFERYHRVPAWFRARCFEPLLARLPRALPLVDKANKYVRRATLPQPRRFFSYNLLHTFDPRSIFTDDFLDAVDLDAPLALAGDHYRRPATTSMLHRLLYLDLKLAITDNDLRKVTRMGELAGVRVRYPMLDRLLVEHSGSIPAWLKLSRGRERHVFKHAFQGLLPPEILRKPKHGFGVPVSRWLRQAPLRDIAHDALLGPSFAQRGYVRRSFLEQLFAWHRDDRTNFFGDTLWVFLMLELWHRAHA
ncbi:MAG: asparagine synthase-related protein [Deltaproteobacteria bacterium]|nr:asparagine synthase-related protein [Deltaproteobacteria bacterium]